MKTLEYPASAIGILPAGGKPESRRRLLGYVLTWPLFVAVLLTTLCVGVAEVVLIERKYGFFSGGFLQAHPLTGTPERVLFFVLATWMDLAFYGALAVLWSWTTRWLRWTPLVRAYHFFVVAAGTALLLAVARYQLLAYFSDTVSFSFLKDLTGGSASTALSYAGEASTAALVAGLLFLGSYLAGLRLVLWLRKYTPSLPVGTTTVRRGWYVLLSGGIALTMAACHLLTRSDNLHYALDEKLSYQALAAVTEPLLGGRDDRWLDACPPAPTPSPFPEHAAASPADLQPAHPRHVVLVVLESVRGEAVGKRVNGRLVAPHLTELAASGSYFPHAYAHQAFTIAAKKALFSGTLAKTDPSHCLFALLKSAGYEVSCFSSMDESFGALADQTGMEAYSDFFFDARQARGDRVYSSAAPGSLVVDDRQTLRVLTGRLGNLDWHKPQFLYMNFQGSHYPYHFASMPQLLPGTPIPRGDIAPGNQAWVEATYWNSVAYVDQLLGELLDDLRRTPAGKDTLVVVAGDHGESLYDDGTLGHGHALNEVQTRIPLVFSTPGIKTAEPIGQVEVMGLLLHAAGVLREVPAGEQPRKAVFQSVGAVQRPSQVGMVEANEERTILDLRTRQVYSSRLGRWVPYQEVDTDPALAERTRQLVAEWRRYRSAEGGWDERN